MTKKKKKTAYNLPQRIYLTGHTQAEMCETIRNLLKIPLSAPEFNRIIRGNSGSGQKTMAVMAEANRIVSEWEENEDG